LKRISANSDPNPKAQKLFRENKMTSFFGQVSRYRLAGATHYFQGMAVRRNYLETEALRCLG